MSETSTTSKLSLGRTVMTEAVRDWIQAASTDEGKAARGIFASWCTARHESGDWGTIEEEDRPTNDYAASHNGMVLSRYELPGEMRPAGQRGTDTKLWVITDAGHAVTTVLFPSDY